MKFEKSLNYASQIKTVVEFLAQAKANDFISGPEAKVLLTDILKDTGFKRPVVVTPKKEA